MKACATAGGGVMFIPEEIERKTQKERVSYKDLVKQEEKERPLPSFGRRKTGKEAIRQAA